MPEQITIAGHTFQVPLRYEEGHELNAKEAAALNQTYHDNLRNCFAPRVKTAIKSGVFDLTVLQRQLDAYAQAYTFGSRQRRTGQPAVDPVAKEALKLARQAIEKQLRQKGIDPKSVETETITAKAKWAVLNRPRFMEQARLKVHQGQDDLTDFMWRASAE